jgi:site-specific DNA-methyltransferase (adenine-specific)
MKGQFYSCIGIRGGKKELQEVSRITGISLARLSYLNEQNKLPDDHELSVIEELLGVSRISIMLEMGIFDHKLISALRKHGSVITELLKNDLEAENDSLPPLSVHQTNFGTLYHGNCMDVMRTIQSGTVDLVFADPPFNLDKHYASNMDDDLPEHKYLNWCEDWISECVRILKDGGSMFLWNIPKWHSILSKFVDDRLTFRNWIATDIKFSLPIQGKLYPSHYSLLYFIKGSKPTTFSPDRLSMDVCRKCYHEIKDYGGYKDKMNPKGINISDVWLDIPPVRHNKYKKRKEANELSIKLLDRIIEMSSKPGDLVFDPFGGSGTTYVVAEMKERRWIGVELGPTDGITERLNNLDQERAYLKSLRADYNRLFTIEAKKQRVKKGIWVEETYNSVLFEKLD